MQSPPKNKLDIKNMKPTIHRRMTGSKKIQQSFELDDSNYKTQKHEIHRFVQENRDQRVNSERCQSQNSDYQASSSIEQPQIVFRSKMLDSTNKTQFQSLSVEGQQLYATFGSGMTGMEKGSIATDSQGKDPNSSSMKPETLRKALQSD